MLNSMQIALKSRLQLPLYSAYLTATGQKVKVHLIESIVAQQKYVPKSKYPLITTVVYNQFKVILLEICMYIIHTINNKTSIFSDNTIYCHFVFSRAYICSTI